MNTLQDSPRLRLLADKIADQADKDEFKPRIRGNKHTPAVAYQIRRLYKRVHAQSGEDYRRSKKVYLLVLKLLSYYQEDLPALMFDALVLMPDIALDAVALQHEIIDEQYHTRREVISQYRFIRDGSARGNHL